MKIAIIGAGGKMGQWLSRFAIEEGLNIIIADRDDEKLKRMPKSPLIDIIPDSREAASQARIIAISVPLNDFESAVREVAPHIKPGSIVLDVCSVKVRPVAVMHEYIKESLVLGTHPLFGPNVNGLSGQNVVLTPTNDKETAFARELRSYFELRGAHVTLMDPEAHDRMMAVVQGLSHFVAIAAADALSGLGTIEEMKDVSTTTFRIFLDYIKSVIGDDPELYAAIQMAHHDMPEIYKALNNSIGKFAELVKEKDVNGFVARMKRLKEYLGK